MESTLPALAVQTLDILTVEQLKAASARHEPIAYADPMMARTELPLQHTFYPYGFPLQVFTNSEEVLSMANDSWHGFHPLFDIAPIRFHIGVTAGGPSECPPPPSSRVREHICSHVADAENFGIADAARAFSILWLSETTLAHRSYIRYFMLESSAMFHLAARYSIGIHGACVALGEKGLLLCGDSGRGQSPLSYACAGAGWTYVTDDASFLVNGREDSLVVGNCGQVRFRPPAADLFPELQGRPVLQRAEIGKPSIELSTAPFSHLSTSFSSPVKNIVFLNRTHHQQPELVGFPRDVARAFILQRGLGITEVVDMQVAGVDRLLDRGIYELRYSDLDWAVERL